MTIVLPEYMHWLLMIAAACYIVQCACKVYIWHLKRKIEQLGYGRNTRLDMTDPYDQ